MISGGVPGTGGRSVLSSDMVLFLQITAGCHDPSDPWSTTRTACGLDEGDRLPWEALLPATDGGFNGVVVPESCADLLAWDLGGDPADLVAQISDAPDLATLLELERLERLPLTGLGALVRGAWWLLASDLGTVEDFQHIDSPYVSEHWRGEYGRLADRAGLYGRSPMSQVLYNHVADSFDRMVFLPEDAPVQAGAGNPRMSSTLQIPRVIDRSIPWTEDRTHPLGELMTLVHEAAHASYRGNNHVDCRPPTEGSVRACDKDLHGAHGAGQTAAWAQVAAALQGRDCVDDSPAGQLAAYGERIVQDARSFLWIPVPDPVLAPCGDPP